MFDKTDIVRALILAIAMISVAACEDSRTVFITKSVVVMPPNQLYQCDYPPRSEWPTGEYTQRDVSRFSARLTQSIAICKESMESVQDFLNEAAKINGGESKTELPPSPKRWWPF